MEHDEVKHEVEVSLVWGGTGETKNAEVKKHESAGSVFDLVYQRFKQAQKPEDTFEVDGNNFPRSEFGKTVENLLKEFGKKLIFEVTPPGSGA